MKKYYLAYGSNLNILEMQKRCPKAKVLGSTKLIDYRLIFKGVVDNNAYLTIEKCLGSSIPVGIFLIDESDEVALDIYEGYPYLYQKENVSINLNGEIITALVYVMLDKYDVHLPSKSYLERCFKGYRDFNFNVKYLSIAYKTTVEELEVLRKKR